MVSRERSISPSMEEVTGTKSPRISPTLKAIVRRVSPQLQTLKCSPLVSRKLSLQQDPPPDRSQLFPELDSPFTTAQEDVLILAHCIFDLELPDSTTVLRRGYLAKRFCEDFLGLPKESSCAALPRDLFVEGVLEAIATEEPQPSVRSKIPETSRQDFVPKEWQKFVQPWTGHYDDLLVEIHSLKRQMVAVESYYRQQGRELADMNGKYLYRGGPMYVTKPGQGGTGKVLLNPSVKSEAETMLQLLSIRIPAFLEECIGLIGRFAQRDMWQRREDCSISRSSTDVVGPLHECLRAIRTNMDVCQEFAGSAMVELENVGLEKVVEELYMNVYRGGLDVKMTNVLEAAMKFMEISQSLMNHLFSFMEGNPERLEIFSSILRSRGSLQASMALFLDSQALEIQCERLRQCPISAKRAFWSEMMHSMTLGDSTDTMSAEFGVRIEEMLRRNLGWISSNMAFASTPGPACSLMCKKVLEVVCEGSTARGPRHCRRMSDILRKPDLFLAVEKGFDYDTVEFLVQQGTDVEAYFEKKTLLHVSAQNGHEQVAEALLLHGANVNAVTRDEKESTPLHLACENGHDRIAEALLDYGANFSTRDNEGYTALELAVLNGHANAAQKLISFGADVNQRSAKGWPLVCTAALLGHFHDQVVLSLVRGGCDVEAYNPNGWNALHLAAVNGHAKVARALLQRGKADPNARTRDDMRTTALHLAAEGGHMVVVRMLVDNARACKDPINSDGESPLQLAQINAHSKVEVFLRDRGALNKGSAEIQLPPSAFTSLLGHLHEWCTSQSAKGSTLVHKPVAIPASPA